MANKKGNNYIIDKEKGIAKIELKRRGKDSLRELLRSRCDKNIMENMPEGIKKISTEG